VQQAQLETGVPIVFGVLTTENLDQALERSAENDNKGEEAVRTALEMVDLLRRLREVPASG
jgi:6,7-dimethyl-8-ribityllumazine synthase